MPRSFPTHDTDAVRAAADRLRAAAPDHAPCAPVRGLIGPDDIDLAYAVQGRLANDRLAGGATIVGRRIGLTSPAVQRQLGVDRPDFGVLFHDMDLTAAETVPLGRLRQPKAETEIAFVLGADLVDGPLDDAQVRAAVDCAGTAREHGRPLLAGRIILSGALGPMVSVTGPCTVTTEVSGLGSATAVFA